MIKKILIPLVSILVTLFLLFIADNFIGWVKVKKEGLLPFPPLTTFRYKTGEFDYVVSINSLGFRDREFSPVKPTPYRILVLGDSFTYGWGVDIEQTWAKVLERNLKNRQVEVEVANLGVPGTSPLDYAPFAQKAIPALKPDLVIIGVLQGDDLAQMKDYSSRERNQKRKALINKMTAVIAGIYPNFSQWLRFSPKQKKLNQEWVAQTKKIYADYNAYEKSRFDKLDDHIKQAFFSGNLNPHLMITPFKTPKFFLYALNLDDPETKIFIDKMAEKFSDIKRVADKNKVKVVVVSVPHPVYISPKAFKTFEKFGFALDPKMLSADSMDEAVKTACAKAGVNFYEFTGSFRKQSDKNPPLYFEWDNHFNPAGHKFLADLLTPKIAEELKGINPGG